MSGGHRRSLGDGTGTPPPGADGVSRSILDTAEINPAKSGDYGSRCNVPVDCIVLHTTEGGSIEGATEWWDREDVVASAHFLLDGERIVQRVPEGMAAYHAGSRVMNLRSIGIEVVGHCDKRETWRPDVMAQLVAVCAELVKRHRIPILHQPGPGICGHCDVPDPKNPNRRGGASHHTDPGQFFPWAEFFDSLREELAEGDAWLA